MHSLCRTAQDRNAQSTPNLHMETDASLCIVPKLDEHIRKRYDIKQIIANEGKYKQIGKNQEGLKQIGKN